MKKSILFTLSLLVVISASAQHTVSLSNPEVKMTLNGMESVDELPLGDEEYTIPISLVADIVRFSIETDMGILDIKVPAGESQTVTILKEGCAPLNLTIINQSRELDFVRMGEAKYKILYDVGTDNSYLRILREKYDLEGLTAGCGSDLERVITVSGWVHGLWQHNGWNEPDKNDAISILEEVEQGENFRCVEYGIVTAACLKAIGLPSRILSLRTEDCETRQAGAGHVVMEVYLEEFGKWAMVDPQFDAMAFVGGVPLNAVELQAAITMGANVNINLGSEEETEGYKNWIYPYLHYFVINFDNREGVEAPERYTVAGMSSLMLVPLGAHHPTVFQNTMPIDFCRYTHSLADFYSAPEI